MELQVLKTHLVHTEDVYDPSGLDYLWTKHTIDVTGVANPKATTYTTQPGNPNPVPAPGSPAFLTIANIRDTLSQPRQPLTFIDEAGNVMLQSPALAPVNAGVFVPGGGHLVNQQPVIMDCDADGGPKPLRPPEVLSVQGVGKTVLVRFAVSTTVNDSVFWSGEGGLHTPAAAPPKPPIILSNRWSAEETLDEGAWSTRVYKGRATFRADLLRMFLAPYLPVDSPPIPNTSRLAIPDDFRSYWASFYVPKGFQRKQVYVQQDPSGFAVDYQITDVQLPVTLTDTRASKLSVMADYGMEATGAEELAFRSSMRLIGDVGDIFGNLTWDPAHDIGEVIGGAFKAFGNQALLVYEGAPRSTDRLVITAEGNPLSTRQQLAGLCYKVLFQLLGAGDAFLSTTRTHLRADLMGKWVQLAVDIQRGPLNTLIKNGLFTKAEDLRSRIPADDGIPGVTTSAPGKQPVYPNDGNLRGARYGDVTGSLIEALVAQSLMNPYTEPPAPPADTAVMQGFPPP